MGLQALHQKPFLLQILEIHSLGISAMTGTQSFLFLLLILALLFVLFRPSKSWKYPSESSLSVPYRRSAFRLSKPLIGEDGKIYACSEKTLFAFESNGTIAWSLDLDFTCNIGTAPVHGGTGEVYIVAENRVLKVDLLKIGTSESATQVFYGTGSGKGGTGAIAGIAVSTSSSSVYINVKGRALFAFMTHGQLLWSAGPVLNQLGYRQGCTKTDVDCYFTSVPVIDQCEGSIYISNTQGELYSLSARSPYFNWIQDLSSFDKAFTLTPGNNGYLYVTIPVRALVLALDTSSGNILWHKSVGPLGSAEYAPVVDSNGWISVGSLDGLLYSFSPSGVLNKFSKSDTSDSVIQVSPLLDCSAYAVYISQTEMNQKITRTSGEYTFVSTMNPKSAVFSLLVPSTGAIYWSESYPGQFSSLLSKSDLQHFVLDESLVLAFLTASKTGNPLPCRTKYQKLVASCSQTRPKLPSIYTGNERAILLFLFFESVVLLVLAVLVRFCCIFWRKKKLQGQHLGNFLEKRRSLQLKKKAFDRSITELEKKVAEDAVANEVIEKFSSLVRERRSVERKLSTTYSLGRDEAAASSESKSLPPVYDAKSRSYSFQGAKKESVTIFHTLSATSSAEGSSEREASWVSEDKDQSTAKAKAKAKAKAPIKAESSSDGDGIMDKEYRRSPSEPASSSRGFINPLLLKQEKLQDKGEVVESMSSSIRSMPLLKRRRTLSSTN
ncbi:protein GAMETE EXPRESSED 3 [Citrus clementina]|uniref:protein GAMETE EXPRESSED 3 n=1 Tax=Citrus clementina TaxID=85681 RepID=UPI000CECF1BE|nr:protein GAMETE EXPRESSED 3 [Citrus x clementina]